MKKISFCYTVQYHLLAKIQNSQVFAVVAIGLYCFVVAALAIYKTAFFTNWEKFNEHPQPKILWFSKNFGMLVFFFRPNLLVTLFRCCKRDFSS